MNEIKTLESALKRLEVELRDLEKLSEALDFASALLPVSMRRALEQKRKKCLGLEVAFSKIEKELEDLENKWNKFLNEWLEEAQRVESEEEIEREEERLLKMEKRREYLDDLLEKVESKLKELKMRREVVCASK